MGAYVRKISWASMGEFVDCGVESFQRGSQNNSLQLPSPSQMLAIPGAMIPHQGAAVKDAAHCPMPPGRRGIIKVFVGVDFGDQDTRNIAPKAARNHAVRPDKKGWPAALSGRRIAATYPDVAAGCRSLHRCRHRYLRQRGAAIKLVKLRAHLFLQGSKPLRFHIAGMIGMEHKLHASPLVFTI
jgi:hypothetical protein